MQLFSNNETSIGKDQMTTVTEKTTTWSQLYLYRAIPQSVCLSVLTLPVHPNSINLVSPLFSCVNSGECHGYLWIYPHVRCHVPHVGFDSETVSRSVLMTHMVAQQEVMPPLPVFTECKHSENLILGYRILSTIGTIGIGVHGKC